MAPITKALLHGFVAQHFFWYHAILNRRKLVRFRGRAAGPRRLLARRQSDPPSSRRGPFDCGSIRVSRPSNRAPALSQIANLREPVDLSRQRLSTRLLRSSPTLAAVQMCRCRAALPSASSSSSSLVAGSCSTRR
jgi:hypothetical protein